MAVLYASTFAVVAPVAIRTSISCHQRQTMRQNLAVSGWPAWSTSSPSLSFLAAASWSESVCKGTAPRIDRPADKTVMSTCWRRLSLGRSGGEA